jgi:hypothetical protein
MTDTESVERFLNELKAKISINKILFLDNRSKNFQSLLDLEITGKERMNCLSDLKPTDYSEGPIQEDFFGGPREMWVFGKRVKKKEVYIKITLGKTGSDAVCISFHIAEHPMKYPFRAGEKL